MVNVDNRPGGPRGSNNSLYFIVGALVIAVLIIGYFMYGGDDAEVVDGVVTEEGAAPDVDVDVPATPDVDVDVAPEPDVDVEPAAPADTPPATTEPPATDAPAGTAPATPPAPAPQ